METLRRKKINILYITPVPYEGAGCRFRIHQYIPYLERKGISCKVSPFLFKAFFRIAYKRGMALRKFVFFAGSFLKRISDLIRALNCEAVVIYRESFPFGPPIFERILHSFGGRIIFDFDDAIFLPDASEVNRMLLPLRRSSNAADIISMSRLTIAGNSFLREYALKFNQNIKIIPTVIDTEKFRPTSMPDTGKIVVGWIGTISTQKYLFSLKGIFRELLGKYPGIEIRIIGAQADFLDIPGITYRQWSLENEVSDIQQFSIGIMPLPDTDWARGKCGFKIIEYMACGVATIASCVGANKEIMQDGINGFLASTSDEWSAKLSLFIENRDLRSKIGLSGRRFVEKNYSLQEYAPKYCSFIMESLSEK